MGYVVIEIQVNANGTVGTLISHYTDEMQAQSKYHSVLAAAALSSLPRHAATMLADDGSYIQHQCFEHAAE